VPSASLFVLTAGVVLAGGILLFGRRRHHLLAR